MKNYPIRKGSEEYRLQLIWDMYQYCTVPSESKYYSKRYTVRDNAIAWDLCQISGAIAGGYRIVLSPHYQGVQKLKRNKELWIKISAFVELKTGRGLLPGDSPIHRVGYVNWEQFNGIQGGSFDT